MKKYQIKYEDGAKRDILEIIDHIENTLLNPLSAVKTAIRIYKKCESLAMFPKGSIVHRVSGFDVEIRFAHIKKYTIVYCVDDGTSTVHIHAVLNSRRDILSALKKRKELEPKND